MRGWSIAPRAPTGPTGSWTGPRRSTTRAACCAGAPTSGSTIWEWDCRVVWSDPADPEAGIVLDRPAFYPGGGGQPPDHGVLLWQGVQTRIVGTRKGDDLYLIPAERDPVPPPGTAVRGALDDEGRR